MTLILLMRSRIKVIHLQQPFKTIQSALLESARFSYLRGVNNDLIERTTILVYPGEHEIDNRPGFAIKDVEVELQQQYHPLVQKQQHKQHYHLDLTSNFDITQEDNILYKFNSINGGVIVPRGTSIVGLDLRKTKIKPKYVPNPTDITVACNCNIQSNWYLLFLAVLYI